MGTSTAGSESQSDKLAKLQARKKELETLLAAKNEDLYKLCVQEVKLTGIMPPEAPAEPSQTQRVDGPRDPSETARKARPVQRDKSREVPSTSRKQVCHRLSTPSISGLSIKSAPTRRADYASTSCSTLSHDSGDNVSLHSSQTYPTLQLGAETSPTGYSRHHSLTTERVCKLYYSSKQPETQSFTRETHFSSSHPDIATQYSHSSLSSPGSPGGNVPLLYQYAAQLRNRSPHLGTVQPRPRRSTLQRTQTYHLTAASEHRFPLAPPLPPAPLVSNDLRVKEKEWYESSLDSPCGSSGTNLSPERPPPIQQRVSLSPVPVPLESPKNCTVVESGKWLPYREVSKPFEMSDFYKYSTKFRQRTSSTEETIPPPTYSSPEQWRQAHPL